MTREKKDFEVAVIGGGIGGLCATLGLMRAGVPVQVFEAAPQFAEIGAGISFGKNASNALTKLGFKEEFDREATIVPSGIWFEWRNGKGDEQELIGTTYSKPQGNSSVHRAKFLDSLVKHVPKEIAHFGKRLTRIEEGTGANNARTTLHFEDGTSHETDVVLGYDGIHSKARSHLDKVRGRKESKLQWSGSWAWRGLIPTQKFIDAVDGKMGKYYAETPQMFIAEDNHILIFPIDKNETVNVVAFSTDRSKWPERPNLKEGEPWTQPSSKEEMINAFPGWGKDMVSIMNCMEKPTKWALHQLIPSLDCFAKGRVAVAGDAAHGGTPHQGAMAGQAIEDALFLSWLLAHPAVTSANVDQALVVYDTVRRPRANRVLESSLEAGDVYEMHGEKTGSDWAKLKHELETRFDWIWEHNHEDDFVAAEKEMRQLGMLKE